MPDLNLGPPPTRSPLPAVAIATVILLAILTTLYFTTWRKQATITITHVEVFAPHTHFNRLAGSAHIVGTPESNEANVYIVATIGFKDNMRIPMFFSTASATMLDSTGAVLDATFIPSTRLPQLEASFPQITQLAAKPLADGDEFSPSTSRDGTITLLFPGIDQDVWKSRKSAALTLNFAHQNPITIPIP